MTGRYLPGLDGLRAVAVAGVIAYHLSYGWASGGYLGVDLFFVLSGFLITSLLVEEWLASGAIRFSHFWGRRARRLLPALLLMIVVVVGFVATQSSGLPIDWGELRGQALATVFYVANWHLLLAHQSYFDQYAVQSPLQHTWSLGIEEQFYIVWPIVILGMLKLVSRTRRRVSWRKAGLVLTVGGFFLSAAWMFYLKQNGASVNRLYYGTDTRAFDLLAGAALAMMVAGRPQPARTARRRLHAASMLAIPALAYCWIAGGVTAASTSNAEPRPWMFQGGLAICAIAAAVVIADVRCAEPGLLGRATSCSTIALLGQDLLRALPVALARDRGDHFRAHPRLRTRAHCGPHCHHCRHRHLELPSGRATHTARLFENAYQVAPNRSRASGDGGHSGRRAGRNSASCGGDGYSGPGGEHRSDRRRRRRSRRWSDRPGPGGDPEPPTAPSATR